MIHENIVVIDTVEKIDYLIIECIIQTHSLNKLYYNNLNT